MLAILGWTGLGLALLQLLISVTGSWRRYALDRRMQRLQMEKLREEVALLRRAQVSTPTPETSWSGFRKFRVLRKRSECEGCQSIYLGPHDGRPLPSYRPGQYLTLSLTVPAEKSPVVRCYSLSESPRENEYRITIKKVIKEGQDNPIGRASGFLSDTIKSGDIVDVKAPRGNFFLDLASTKAVVCIGAGIGITPLVAMLETLLGSDPAREAFLFLGMRNSREHPFKEYCETLATRHPNFRLVVCYSRPLEVDRQGEDYQRSGRLDARIVSAILPSSNYEYFVCGPSEFMGEMVTGLRDWGAREESIHSESFGPSSFKELSRAPVTNEGDTSTRSPQQRTAGTVRFDRARRDNAWDGSHACLLDLAESIGIAIPSGCRTGSCGSCATAIKAGRVSYTSPADFACEDGVCIPCVCVPDGDLVLDA